VAIGLVVFTIFLLAVYRVLFFGLERGWFPRLLIAMGASVLLLPMLLSFLQVVTLAFLAGAGAVLILLLLVRFRR
jgi:hypothetical protein